MHSLIFKWITRGNDNVSENISAKHIQQDEKNSLWDCITNSEIILIKFLYRLWMWHYEYLLELYGNTLKSIYKK